MPDNAFAKYDVTPSSEPPSSNVFAKYDVTPKDTAKLSWAETGRDVAKSAGIGVVKGGIGLAGMVGDASNLGAKGIEAASNYISDKLGVDRYQRPEKPSVLENIPTSESIQSGIEAHTGEFYKPKTTLGEYAQTGGEFAAGAALGPMNGARAIGGRVLRYGVAPAITSETAGQLTKGSAAEPYVRAGTALLTGGAAAAMHRPASAEAAIRDQLPGHVTDAHINAAQNLMQEAQSRGIRLSWDEALSQVSGRPVLQDMRRVVESAPQSRPRMQEFTQDRPLQIQDAAQQAFYDIAPQSRAPNSIGPAVGQAAEGTINDVRGAINANDEPNYRAASTVLLNPAEMARVRAIPGYEQAAAEVRGDAQLNRDVAHLPDNSVGFLNEVKKQLDQAAQNARAPMAQNPNMQRAAGLGTDATNVRDTLTRTSADYAQALHSQETNRARYLEPLLQGPLGKIADRDITTKKAISSIFEHNPLPGSEEEVGTAVAAIAHRNPQAARDLVRAHAEMAFNEASRSIDAEGTQFSGAKFAKVIAGNPQQRANLREAVRALPNGDARWNGFNRFLDVMEATGERQALGSKTSFNDQELARLAKQGGITGAVQTLAAPSAWAGLFKQSIEQWKLGRNLDQLADILTNPRSGDLLRRIANSPTQSQSAMSLSFRLLAQTNTGAHSGVSRLYVSPNRGEPPDEAK